MVEWVINKWYFLLGGSLYKIGFLCFLLYVFFGMLVKKLYFFLLLIFEVDLWIFDWCCILFIGIFLVFVIGKFLVFNLKKVFLNKIYEYENF